VVGYFVEWGVYARGYTIEDIPADKLTHINYAFINVIDGRCAVYDSWAAFDLDGGNMPKLAALRDANPGLSTLMSVGGWTLSGGFSALSATEEGRAAFATSCVDFMLDHGFDGIDIDWEYPVSGGLSGGAPEDTENQVLLLAALRAELDSRAPGSLLTIAAPAGASKIANIDPAGIAASVDWINLMSYDFAGGWDSATGLHNPLYAVDGAPGEDADTNNVDAAVQAFLDAGVPPAQLVVGVPLYGRGWGSVGGTNQGLFQSGGYTGEGTWEGGVFDYDDIVNNYLTDSRYTRHWSESGLVPYLYSESTGVFITYEDEESLGYKLDYINSLGLGGVMTWEIDADTDDHEFLGLLADRFIP
jgi:chitinase